MKKLVVFHCKGWELGDLKKLYMELTFGREIEPLEDVDFSRN